jgi:hypothetical protein
MMDNTLKTKWTAALRSGDYSQTSGLLTRLDLNGNVIGHCCLGVLCEIAGLESESRDGYRRYNYGDSDSAGTIPFDFSSSIGIDSSDETVLIAMNDNDGYTFLQIADWIEQNL